MALAIHQSAIKMHLHQEFITVNYGVIVHSVPPPPPKIVPPDIIDR